jgi:hypothetical protein
MIFVGCLLLGAGPAAAPHILAGFLGSGESVLGNEPVALMTATLTVAVVFLGAVGLILFAKHRSPDGSSSPRSLRASAPAQKQLTSEDFPLSAEGEKLVTQQGERIADTESKPMAKDMAGRLNDDETRREENRWSIRN